MGCRVEPTYVMFGVAFPSQAFFEIRWVNKYGSNGESSRCQQVPLKSLRRLNQSTIDVLVIDIDSYMWIEHPFGSRVVTHFVMKMLLPCSPKNLVL